MCLTLNIQGVAQTKGSGTAKVITTGHILDKQGNKIGDFYNIAMKELEAWEKVLDRFGIEY